MGKSLQPSATLLGLSPADIYCQNCECLLPTEKHLQILSNTACAWAPPSGWVMNTDLLREQLHHESWGGGGFLSSSFLVGFVAGESMEGDPE